MSQTIFQREGLVHSVLVVPVEEVLLVLLGLDCFQPLTLWVYSPVMKVSLTDEKMKSYPFKCEHGFSNCDLILFLFPYVCKHACKNKTQPGCEKLISDLFSKDSTWLPHSGMSYVFVSANNLIHANQSEFYCQSLLKMLAQALYRRESPL